MAGVRCRSYSLPLQRAISDFGADHPFHSINKKLQEHYGIEVPTESARKVTEHHAQAMAKREQNRKINPLEKAKNPKTMIIAEADGSMIPIVQYQEASSEAETFDKRKHKTLAYCEARLSLAHEKDSSTLVFGGTLGTVQEAGEQLMGCVKQVGFDAQTKVHCVGDGAAWIANQVEEQFGANGIYLVDFYHLCEYLLAAAKSCAKEKPKEWIEDQKALLKESRADQVLLNLQPYQEAGEVCEADAPVRACYRYIQNRHHQLDYKTAIENDLPIGSGEVESAHRYII